MAKLVVSLTDTKIKAEISTHKKNIEKPKNDGGSCYLYR